MIVDGRLVRPQTVRVRSWLVALLLMLASACGDGDGDGDNGDGCGDGDVELASWCQAPSSGDFSFFVTSMAALWAISGDSIDDQGGGLGGDFGGLVGADVLCQRIGTAAGAGDRTWRAFLSASEDGSGSPVHAIERIGVGPWFDANGRMVATGIGGLLSAERPDGDAQSTSDLPDECGVGISNLGDAHDVVTGSDDLGRLASADVASTCNDWTSSDGAVGSGGSGSVMCGHSFPRRGSFGGQEWLSDHPLRGCGKGANLLQNGPGSGTCIGCSGGFGAIYCFASD